MSVEPYAAADGSDARVTAALLELAGLSVEIPTRSGQTVYAVNDVSLSIGPSETVGIIGETGSGKSTLARAITGLLPSTARIAHGNATVRSHERVVSLFELGPRAWRDVRGRVIGFVPQSTAGALNPVLTIARQFESIQRAHHKMSKRDVRETAVANLRAVGLQDPDRVLDGYAHQLSGGMAQRVVIAMTMSLAPDLIIADEPTTGLDVTVQKQLLDELRRLTRSHGQALLLVTHDTGVVAQYCDRVLVLYAGFAIEEGPVSEVLRHPRHPYTRLLLDAVPRRGRELRSIPGAVGDLFTRPTGCPFYDRCPIQHPRCKSQMPPLTEVGPEHRVATFCTGESS